MKRKQPRRYWVDARAKVEVEGGCRFYRSDLGCAGPIEAAHVIGREHDELFDQEVGKVVGIKGTYDLYVDLESIVPLCKVHHDRYDGRDRHRIDILHVLTLEEQLQAVRDAGSVESMRRRTAPALYAKERAA